jgi:signal transduction histidine kinase
MEWSSSHAALLVSIGICAYIAALHLALARSDERAHLWVAAWCIGSLVFLGARYAQLHTSDVQVAVTAARLYAAIAPVLIWTLVGFCLSLHGSGLSTQGFVAYSGFTLALAFSMGATPWFLTGHTEMAQDWFGHSYIGVPSAPPMLLIGPLIAVGLAFAVRTLRRAPEITTHDRRILIGALAVYAGMGLISVLSSADLISLPGLAEFGPLVVGVGLNQLLVRWHVRVRDRLGEAVALRTEELEAANQRLANEQAHYRGLFDHVPSAVSVWSFGGDLLDLNRAARALTQVEGQIPEVNAFETEAMRESGAAELIRRAASTGRAVHSETRLQIRAGSFDLLLSAAPLGDGDSGTMDKVLLIGEDVGERRELEDALRQTQKLDALGRLAAGIAHEINNPLAFVRSNLGQLRRDWNEISEELRKNDQMLPRALSDSEEVIEDSVSGVERVIGLVRDIKGYAHSAPVETGPHAVDQLVADAVRMACVDQSPSVTIDLNCDASLPPVECQPNRLGQVFLNLVSNALDAVGEQGTVSITMRREAGRIVVQIADDGCGMDAETRQNVLEPFFTTKPAGVGTGLGLYVAHEIVRWHRGELRIDSEPGCGSAVEVWLPIERDAEFH